MATGRMFHKIDEFSKLKGTVPRHRFSTSGFFHESVSPKPLSIPVGPFRFFSKIRGDIRSSRLPPVSTTLAKLVAKFATGGKFAAGVVETGGNFAAAVVDTGGKFVTGVVDTGGSP
jgi:hypothetical protein